MTPKEKAKQLYDLYMEILNINDMRSTVNPFAKDCTLTLIHEIERVFCSMPLGEQYGYLFQLEYWEEVKQEIKKF